MCCSSSNPGANKVCMLRFMCPSMRMYIYIYIYLYVCVCVLVCYSMCSAGKFGSKRFQAWSAMKAQLRDKSAAAAHR